MQTRPQFAVKLLPSLADFAFLMPIAYVFGRMDGVKTLLSDCDTGWHIRTGEWIIANGWVPVRDIFSFSKPGAPWYAWEWLSDVLFAKLNALGGLQAVVGFTILLLSVAVCAPVSAGAAKIKSHRCRWSHHGSGRGLVDSLAGPPALVHAVVPGPFLRSPGAGARRPHAPAGRADSGGAPRDHDSLDQPARRFLHRRPDDYGLRRRRDAAKGLLPEELGPFAGLAEGPQPFCYR